jgi:FBP C-terminal treble-clef zinc-finger
MHDHPHRRRLTHGRREGRQGRAAGQLRGRYLCSDLACPLYVRGKKDAGAGARLHETLTLGEKIQRTVANLAAFIAKVTT